MPDMEENHQNPRKHRVIHWNPEDEEAAERARSSKRKLIAVGVSAAVVVVLLVSVIALWENPDKDAKALTDRLGITDETVPEVPFQQAFASRSKADLELETANSGLEKIRQMRVNHPVLTTKLVAVEREFLQGEDLMRRKAFDRAFETFKGVNVQIEDFSNLVEAKLATKRPMTMLSTPPAQGSSFSLKARSPHLKQN